MELNRRQLIAGTASVAAVAAVGVSPDQWAVRTGTRPVEKEYHIAYIGEPTMKMDWDAGVAFGRAAARDGLVFGRPFRGHEWDPQRQDFVVLYTCPVISA